MLSGIDYEIHSDFFKQAPCFELRIRDKKNRLFTNQIHLEVEPYQADFKFRRIYPKEFVDKLFGFQDSVQSRSTLSFNFLDDFFVKVLPNGNIFLHKHGTSGTSEHSRIVTSHGNVVVFDSKDSFKIFFKHGEIECFKDKEWKSLNKEGFEWINEAE